MADAIVIFRTNLKDRAEITAEFGALWCKWSRMLLHNQPYINFMDKDAHFVGATCLNDLPLVGGVSFGCYANRGIFNNYWGVQSDTSRIFDQRGDINVLMDHNKMLMDLFFVIPSSPGNRNQLTRLKCRIMYNSITDIVVNMRAGVLNTVKHVNVFFTVRHAPLLWRGLDDDRPNHRGQESGYVRCFNYPGCTFNLGDCNVICLTVPESMLAPNLFKSRVVSLRGGGLISQTTQLLNALSRIKSRTKRPVQFGYILSRRVDPDPPKILVPVTGHFPIDYAVEALLMRGFEVVQQFSRTDFDRFLLLVDACARNNAIMTERVLHHLICAIDEGKQLQLWRALWIMFQVVTGKADEMSDAERELDKLLQPGEVPENCVMVRKVIVSPLRQRFMVPEVMMKNRIIRTFGDEKALRVVLRDEHNRLRHHFLQDSPAPIAKDLARTTFSKIIKRPLLNGINIGGEIFDFLGWSNSQMRDNGCYMYAPARHRFTNEVYTVEDMRRYMGDFRHITSIPKLMSRMGQCFTQGIASIKLTPEAVRCDPDIIGGDINPETDERYTFTDGIGRISVAACKRIREKLKLEYLPSAFQIRFHGYKGMVCMDPSLDVYPNGPQIVFRESMRKFVAKHTDLESTLEIVKYSMPGEVYLNKQTVMIIDQVAAQQGRGKHHTVCRRLRGLLENDLFSAADMLLNESECVEALTQRVPLAIDFDQLRRSGIRLTSEPHFRALLLAMHRYKIKANLCRGKIEMPANLGRNMFGVVDDCGMLMYGQVFIQYSPHMKKPSQNSIVLKGAVLVTKNPGVHPGDVRILEAVDIPGLHHLHDVIVFPRWGQRPHSDEMAGSDLDGDEYAVYWDKEIMFVENIAPMHFPKVKAPVERNGMHKESMVNFMVKFMTEDSIGRISNAHLAMADQLEYGIFSDVCNDIARKCSLAVDFAKTGVPAEDLERDERPSKFPDFMRKPEKPAYKSKFILGHMFRVTRRIEELVEVGQGYLDKHIDLDTQLETNNWRAYENSASKELKRYTNSMESIMDSYGVDDEASLLSGHLTIVRNKVQEQAEDYNFFNTEKLVEMRVGLVISNHRKSFFAEFGGEDPDYLQAPSEEMRDKASAWYITTYKQAMKNRKKRDEISGGRLLGLPWILWEILANIKMNKMFEDGLSEVVTDPLSNMFNGAILGHTHQIAIQVHSILNQNTYVVEMCAKYEGLKQLIDVILHWITKEGLFEAGYINQLHIALLVIQFGKRERVDDLAAYLPMKPMDISSVVASYLLDFLKYVAGDAFRNQYILHLHNGSADAIMLKNGEWLALNVIAFTSYHHIALSGQLTSLHFTSHLSTSPTSNTNLPWDFGEMEPQMIELAPEFATNDLERLLKEWSGVTFIDTTREESRRQGQQLCVMATGDLDSRHKLRKILLTDDLLRDLQNNSNPLMRMDQDF